MTPWCYII